MDGRPGDGSPSSWRRGRRFDPARDLRRGRGPATRGPGGRAPPGCRGGGAGARELAGRRRRQPRVRRGPPRSAGLGRPSGPGARDAGPARRCPHRQGPLCPLRPPRSERGRRPRRDRGHLRGADTRRPGSGCSVPAGGDGDRGEEPGTRCSRRSGGRAHSAPRASRSSAGRGPSCPPSRRWPLVSGPLWASEHTSWRSGTGSAPCRGGETCARPTPVLDPLLDPCARPPCSTDLSRGCRRGCRRRPCRSAAGSR